MKTFIIPLLLAAALCVLAKTDPPVKIGHIDDPVAYVPDLAADNPTLSYDVAIGFMEDTGHFNLAVTDNTKSIPPAYKVVNIQDAGFAFEHHGAMNPIDVGIGINVGHGTYLGAVWTGHSTC